MCLFPVSKVYLDPPPKKKPAPRPNYTLVSDHFNVQPIPRHHHDATSSAAGVSGSHHTHRVYRPTPQNNRPIATTPAPVNMPRWQPAPFGGAMPAAVVAPAPAPAANNPWTNPGHAIARAAMGLAAAVPPAPAANNPWTNPSHPTARAAMGLATAAVSVAPPDTGHHHRWHPAPVAVAAAPHVGHHHRWHPAPAAAAAAAPPNNPWNHFATLPYYQIYSWAQQAPIYQPGGGGNVQFYTSTLQNPGPTHFTTQDGRRMQIVPEIPTPNSQYYCRELDGSYTERTYNQIMHDCQPGEWRPHPETQFPYWYRLRA
ncbi:hypothetical protein N7G274_009469 [Stereocaulon virgatum]|uniref:Uncharacterized protein n=1 Tax=Stereocaulon virgatum TaxID=373712 RepID=A0ABR3ZYY4_9LECA